MNQHVQLSCSRLASWLKWSQFLPVSFSCQQLSTRPHRGLLLNQRLLTGTARPVESNCRFNEHQVCPRTPSSGRLHSRVR